MEESLADTTNPPLKLHGKKVFIAGELAWHTQNEVRSMIVSEGGEISPELSEQCDLVIVGADAGKTPAAVIEAERLNEGGANIRVMPESDFVSFCLPEREEIIGLLRTGDAERLEAFTDLVGKLSRTSEPWFDLSCVNLSGLDLEGFRFGEFKLEGGSFEKTRLRNCRFSYFCCHRLNFKDAQFARVRLPQLDQCQCNGATFKQMYFRDCSNSDLSNCQFDRVIFAEEEQAGYATLIVTSNFSNASFLACMLDTAKFGECDLSSTNWTGCELLNVGFSDCRLPMAVFKDAWLISVKFENADLTGADFTNANLAFSDLRGAKIDGANFTGCNLAGANVEGINPDHATGFKEALEKSSTGADSCQSSAIAELDECAQQARSFEITFEIEGASKTTLVGIIRSASNVYVHLRFKKTVNMFEEPASDTFNFMTSSLLQESVADAIQQATCIFRGLQPRVESINAKLTKGSVTSKQFKTLAIRALSAAFGIEAPGKRL